MITEGLSAAQQRDLRATITAPYRARTRIELQDLAGNAVADLTPYFADGQADVDSTAAVTRSASVVLHDETRSLPFDTDHPATTALYFDRMLRITWGVLVGGTDWVDLPVFTGPITKLDRDGDQVTVECQGKEVMLLGAAWAPLTLAKNMRRTDAIIRLLREGNPVYREPLIDVPDAAARLPKAISLTRESVPWLKAKSIARSMNRQLFYDGAGRARLRTYPGTVGFTFTGQHHVTSPIQVSFSSELVNAVAVEGGIPKGSKKPVTAVAVAPASHPLSPRRVGRYLLPDGQIIRDDSIKTTKEAQALADSRLEDGLLQAVEVSFDSAPVHFLDPADLCHVATDDGSVTFRLQKFSLPLVANGQAMSVGYTRRVSMRGVKRRNRR